MAGEPSAMALIGDEYGAKYTNPFGNTTVIDTVPEEILPLIHAHWYQYPPMNPLWYGLVAMWVFVCWLMACSGNLIVIWVFMNTKSLRSPANYYVVNLALSDFTLMFCMCPPLLYNSYHHTWMFSATACYVYAAIGSLTGFCSIQLMIFISMDRYNVIVKGIGGTPLTTGKALAHCAFCWIHSCFWTFPPFFGWGRYTPEGNMTACGTDYFSRDMNNQTYIYLYTFVCYFLPFFLICFFYFFIVKAVSDHEKQMKAQAAKMGVKSLRGDKDAQNKSSDCKLAKVALMTVSLWFMAWTPYTIINMSGLLMPEIVTPLFSIWGSVFAKANTVYNPIIYAISHPKYKAALYNKLPCLACTGDDGNSDDSKSTASNATATEPEKA